MGQPWEWAQYGWNQWHSAPSAWTHQPSTQYGYQPPQSWWEFQLHPSAEQQGQFGSTYTTAEDVQEQPVLDPNYCLVDASGNPKPFSVSHISQVSGRTYEACVSAIVMGMQSRKLRAVQAQTPEDQMRLTACRDAVAEFLKFRVSEKAASDAGKRGIGAEEMEVDAVFQGSFKDLTPQLERLGGRIHTPGTCDEVAIVLVEVCSDSRFVAMKLLQLEIQCSLLTRKGFLVNDETRGYEAIQLDQEKTGFAIVFNRAALQFAIREVVEHLEFTNISNLLEKNKLQIIYFQAETGVPAALQLAVEAHKKISELHEQLQQMQGSSEQPQQTKAVWVRQLRKDDIRGFEFAGNAFQVKDKELQNIDDLKKAINPSLPPIEASKIDIYLQQEDGRWEKEDADAEIKRGALMSDCYGFLLPD